jgi:hypothetical protein
MAKGQAEAREYVPSCDLLRTVRTRTVGNAHFGLDTFSIEYESNTLRYIVPINDSAYRHKKEIWGVGAKPGYESTCCVQP